MIGYWVATKIGIIFVGFGLTVFFSFVMQRDVVEGIMALIICVAMGFLFLTPPLSSRCRELTYTYEQPTSILKTNNITIVTYVDTDIRDVKYKRYDSAEMWNSTNILIQKTMGRNFFWNLLDGYDWEFVAGNEK